jgi:hypothetical protein
MKAVIQCAGDKNEGGYFRAPDGRKVRFVARPELVPTFERHADLLARPDDLAFDGRTWRDLVRDYNMNSTHAGNPLELWPAYKLYRNAAYGRLVETFGVENVFILSAGWGLLPANFLIPNYDITFSSSAEAWQRRRKADHYSDFTFFPVEAVDRVVFFGGKDYLPLFLRLTGQTPAERVIFFASQIEPMAPGCRLVRYDTTARTNWHYACAEKFASGRVAL